ncbi:unnamed protein product [Ectocarpus sp. 6 AP-2014]
MKPTSGDGTGDHPLHVVKDPVVAVMLIAGGGDVNAKNGMGLKPLHMASNVGVASVLLANGACPFSRTNTGRSSIHWARNDSIARVLLARGVDANDRIDGIGDTPLMHALTLEMCKVLIEGGAMVDAVDSQGRTALLKMCERLGKAHKRDKDRYAQIIEYLARAGASFEVMDTGGHGVQGLSGGQFEAVVLPIWKRTMVGNMQKVIEKQGLSHSAKVACRKNNIICMTLAMDGDVRDGIMAYM